VHGSPDQSSDQLVRKLQPCRAAGLSEGVIVPPTIGHNGGPPLEEELRVVTWGHYCWRKAHGRAWKTPPREIALARLKRAEELGMTYRDYTAVVLDRGVLL
jgi:hypothetical protein